LQDDRIIYRKLIGKYNPDELALLEAVAKILAPMIRQYGKTVRSKGPKDGYSQPYRWGSKNFMCDMAEIDVDRLFHHDPDEGEFRDHDNPAHDNRVASIPETLVKYQLHKILTEAWNGPLVRVGANPILVSKSEDLARLLGERREQ
jgi:hypothetical protein